MTENDNFFYAFAANPGFIEIPSIILAEQQPVGRRFN